MQGDITTVDGTTMSKGAKYDEWLAKQKDMPKNTDVKREDFFAKAKREREERMSGKTTEPVPPEQRPQGDNYRLEAKRAMLQDMIAGDQAIIDKLGSEGSSSDMIFLARAKTSLTQSKDILKNMEKNDKKMGLPHIPMGKNTHTKNTKGFVHSNKSSILIDKRAELMLPTRVQMERVKSAWNNLPDDIRDNVKILNIKYSTAKGNHQGGRWTPEKSQLTMNLNPWDQEPLHNFYHEVGHSTFDSIRKTNPEKIKRFIEKQKEIGQAPTPYSQRFSIVHIKEEDKQRIFIARQEARGVTLSPRNKRIMAQNLETVKDLYQDEIHAELNAYVMGELPEHLIKANKKDMKAMLEAYKEMHDL